MKNNLILTTERLGLRKLNLNDSGFILELLNTPSWKKYIGDRNVNNLDDAKKYLRNGPLNSYEKNGFGLYLVFLKNKQTPIGLCGLIKRDFLENVDLGYALMPSFTGYGYAFEIARATMHYAENFLEIKNIVAIIDFKNIASVKLVYKLGMQFNKIITYENKEQLLMFSFPNNQTEMEMLNKITETFFSVFKNKNLMETDWLKKICVENAVFINNSKGTGQQEKLLEFIETRKKILADGLLKNFEEKEITSHTEIFGNIAHRFVLYQKTGELNREIFKKAGKKSIQFIKEKSEWKIHAVVWQDV